MSAELDKIKEAFDLLVAEKAQIEELSAPLKLEREQIAADVLELNARSAELAAEIASIERPRIIDINHKLAALAKILGGKKLSDGGTSS